MLLVFIKIVMAIPTLSVLSRARPDIFLERLLLYDGKIIVAILPTQMVSHSFFLLLIILFILLSDKNIEQFAAYQITVLFSAVTY